MAERELRHRRRLLQLHHKAGVGHLGGNLSCLDLIIHTFAKMNWQQDRFVLSKGHSAGALYTALWGAGRISEVELNTYYQDGTLFGGHPSPLLSKDIPFFTGSLGHGLSAACGLALGKELSSESGRIFALTSDGEWQEGSCWEALHFATHHQLDALTILVDFNQIQGFGRLAEVLSMQDLPQRLRHHRLQVLEIDGHDSVAIEQALAQAQGQLSVVVAHTKKGKGISFMEDTIDWHYWTMNDEQYQKAILEIDSQLAKLGVIP